MSRPSMCTNEDPRRCARPVRGLRAARALVVMLLAAASAAARPDAVAPQAAAGAAHDAVATDAARVLAGLTPFDAARYKTVTSRPAWQAYREEVSRNWSRLDRERLAPMRVWSGREVTAAAGPCDTLFYPFGGPDLLNAYVLFPECSRYLLFGLEPVGTMPSLEREDPRNVDGLVTELRTSLSDVFIRDYFITREMMTELKTPGVNGTLPLLLVFLARLDARIVDVRMGSPWAEGTATEDQASAQDPAAGAPRKPPQRPTAVTIRFTAAGSTRVQTVSYARVRMEDVEFARQEALLAYLQRHAPYTTLLKSASYLLHDNQFSKVRAAVLEDSRAVLQDDTGVPFRFFDRNTWRLTLYGKYSPPVKDFNYGSQPDLEAAYRTSAEVRALPFSFGYHWRQGTSSVMLAVRKASARRPAAATPPR